MTSYFSSEPEMSDGRRLFRRLQPGKKNLSRNPPAVETADSPRTGKVVVDWDLSSYPSFPPELMDHSGLRSEGLWSSDARESEAGNPRQKPSLVPSLAMITTLQLRNYSNRRTPSLFAYHQPPFPLSFIHSQQPRDLAHRPTVSQTTNASLSTSLTKSHDAPCSHQPHRLLQAQ